MIWAHVYDIDKVVGGGPDGGLVGKIPIPGDTPGPSDPSTSGYHDFYVGYDLGTHRTILRRGRRVLRLRRIQCQDPKLFTPDGIAGI